MTATPPTMATTNRLKKDAAFVLMQTPVRSCLKSEAEKGLSMLGMVCPHLIVMRNAYQGGLEGHGIRAGG